MPICLGFDVLHGTTNDCKLDGILIRRVTAGSCPRARNGPASHQLMGRGWTILEAGNRGNVLMRSVGAQVYGDLSEWVSPQFISSPGKGKRASTIFSPRNRNV
jgi:hypothetical protein